MVIEDILVTHDSGSWNISEFLVIGELNNLILVIGELRGVYIPLIQGMISPFVISYLVLPLLFSPTGAD